MGKVILIDGHSILNRAYYGVPLLSNAEGLHTNAVYGFLNIMLKILDEEPADYLAVAFDVHAPTFRHEMFDGYKGTRKPMPEELREQVPVIKEVLHAMQIPTIEQAGYEADDILGTLAGAYADLGYEVSIISGDRDLLQLATDHIKIRIPKTKMTGTEIEDYYAADVLARYQVSPTEFIDLKALMGDASDNIPGVPGIGEKTASKIISTYHSIENAYAHVSELKPKKASENLLAFYDQAVLSKTLATIKTDCALDFHPEDAAIGQMLNEASYKIFKRLELKNILKRFDNTAPVSKESFEAVRMMTDFGECTQWCAAVNGSDTLGLRYFCEDDFEGLAVCKNGDQPIFIPVAGMMTSDYLRMTASDMIHKAKRSCMIDVKSQLPYLDISESDAVFDAAVAAYLLNPLKESYTSDSIAQDFLNMTIPSRSDWLGKLSLSEAGLKENKNLQNYLAYEALIPFMVCDGLMQKLSETGMLELFTDVEMPLTFTLYDMETAGIRVEKEALAAYGEQLTGRIGTLEQNIYELAGETFNINSPKQLGVILFEKMHLPFAKKTKTGYSTSAEVLEKLRGYDPIIGQILEYRQLTKLKSTYADGLAGYINPEDNRIHGKFNQTITATGRISSTEPNLQNIPVRMELGRLIRKVFVPEDGYVFVNADYSQIELRVLAHMAGDANLIRAYREAQDIHRMTASQVFHTPFDEVTPAQRSNAKAVNFGIVYGISSFSLSQDLSITKKEADAYIEQYFQTYPGIRDFLDKSVADAREKGYAVTMFGRRRPVPELSASNFMQRSFGERIAMNSPIQGTAADIIKIAMVHVNRRLKKEQLKSRLILQIHDELLIEAPEDEVEAVKKLLKEEMEQAVSLAVPLDVDMHTGHNWYELK
jgi:DNA polymerase-1